MKVIQKYNQNRRDCWADMECENCKNLETDTSAYDDTNYWQNVVPTFKCENCQESTNSLNLKPVNVQLKYDPNQIV